MNRVFTIAAAQLGPIARNESRSSVVDRLLSLMHQAHSQQCRVIVYPELALTTFFPRWFIEDQNEIDAFFESSMPSEATKPLFEQAHKLNMGFFLGYAELCKESGQTRRFNSSVLVDAGTIVGKYRKVHLPGHEERESYRRFQHLERRYFEPGDNFDVWRAFNGVVGMCLCNDRRWPETYRVMALKGVELVLLGYNTPAHYPPAPEMDKLAMFHNHLVMQAGAHQNGAWVVGVAKGGVEEGVDSIGGSCIIAPSGEIVAQARGTNDELIVAECDLDMAQRYKKTLFDFEHYRRPETYRLIAEQKGPIVPKHARENDSRDA